MAFQRSAHCCSRRSGLAFWSLIIVAMNVTARPARAEISQPKLAEFVRDAIKTDAITYEPSRVSINGRELDYNPGKILYPNYGNKPNTPIGYPIETQSTVELLRKFRAKDKEELAFLERYLVQVEKVVADELALIANHRGSANDLIKKLADQNKRAQQILADGIEKWAAKKGLSLSKNQSHAVAVMPTVKFETNPAGAAVYYLNAVDYNVYKADNVLGQMDRWNQAPGKQMDMGGAYYFRAAWPGGKMKQTAKILIDKEQTISFQAN
jgi:hypothetical protein